MLVAGAELKSVKDQIKAAEDEGNATKVSALKDRLLRVAGVLEKKLQGITPIIQFLMQQSVDCLKESHPVLTEETKKDQ